MLTGFTCTELKTALVILDMQRYFTESHHAFAHVTARLVEGGRDYYFSRVDGVVIPNILSTLALFRQNHWPVFFTEFGSHRPDGADLPSWARRMNALSRNQCQAPIYPFFEEPQAQIDDRLKPQFDEPVFRKTTTGAVASSSLEMSLRACGITHVIITGVVTAFCVTQTARELADRNFDVAIIEDACASFSQAGHDAALTAFAGAYGWVLSTEQMTQTVSVTQTPPDAPPARRYDDKPD